MFERTGRVVLLGIVAATAPSPSCNFSRVIESLIELLVPPVAATFPGGHQGYGMI
jgi:hypothetical protein